MEEYQDIGKSLQNLMKGQKRNITQLERIGAIVEQKQCLKEENEKKESRDDEEGSKNSPEESQEVVEERILLSTSYQYSGFVPQFFFKFCSCDLNM